MSSPETTASPHPSLGFKSFVLQIAALQALGALGIDSMLPNLPAIGASFGLQQENQRQLVITVYLMGFGGAQILYGFLSDRFGRKPVLLFGVAFYVAFSALAAFSPSFPVLLAARALQGVGAAATRSLPISVVRDCYAGRQMARVMSLAFMVFLGVPMVAPSIGQAIALVASWRWVFGFLTLFGAVVLVWTAVKLPETLHPQDRTPIQLDRIVHNFSVALRSRVGMGYAAAMTFIVGALFGFVNAVQQVFAEVFHAAAIFPAVFACLAGSIALGSMLNARLVARIGMRPLAHSALIGFITVSTVHAIVVLSGRETLLTFAVLQAGAMFSFGLLSGNFGAMAMEPLGHVAGAAASLQGALSMFGGSLIGFLIGQQFNGTAAPIAVGYALCGVGALACVLYAERGRLFRPNLAPVAAWTLE
jgi:DHA1 family bicyclomycin/chloramphenicol resistance-like MFS transporter